MTKSTMPGDTVVAAKKVLPAVPAARIVEELSACDQDAVEHQRNRQWWGTLTITISSSLLLILALHLLAETVPDEYLGHDAKIWINRVFVGMEILAFLFLIFHFFPTAREHEAWVRERVRAELLRREQHLLAARVGPYLTAGDAADEVHQRIEKIRNDSDPLLLIEPQSDARLWIESLEDSRLETTSETIPDLRYSLEEYDRNRITKQHGWFIEKAEHHTHTDERLESFGRVLLLLGLLVAIVNGFIASESIGMAISIFLAACGEWLVGRRSMFQAHRLRRSYADYAKALARVHDQLERLIARAESEPLHTEFQFKRLVLRTEEMLAHELRLWWLTIDPEVPQG